MAERFTFEKNMKYMYESMKFCNLYDLPNRNKLFRGIVIISVLSINVYPLTYFAYRNVEFAYRGGNYMFSDLMECLSGVTAAMGLCGVTFFIWLGVLDAKTITDGIFRESRFPTPIEFTNRIHIFKKMHVIIAIYSFLVPLSFCLNGLQTLSKCLHENILLNVQKSCGLPMPLVAPITLSTWAIYFYNVSFILIVGYSGFAMLTFFSLIQLCCFSHCVRMEILVDKLGHLKMDMDDKYIAEELKYCCEYIIDSFTIMAKLNKSLKYFSLIYLYIPSLCIGIILYQFMHEVTIKGIVHISGWIIGMMVLNCWAQLVENWNESVLEAVYDLPWYREEYLKHKNEIILLMIISKETVVVKVAGFTLFSHEQFANLMKKAFSFCILVVNLERL